MADADFTLRDVPPEPVTRDGSKARDLFVDGADLPAVAREMAVALADQPHLFDRGGPARLTRDAATGGMVSDLLTFNSVVVEAHKVLRPWRFVMRGGTAEREDVTLPDRVAKLYLDSRDMWGLRALDGVTTAPLLGQDGAMREVDGYDPQTRLWCENLPALSVPPTPTEAQAKAALHRIRSWFKTFAFADSAMLDPEDTGERVPVVDLSQPPGADESAMLVGLLTAVCRPCLWLAPGFMIRAPELSGAGTGKGMLVRAMCAIAYGRAPSALTAGHDNAELDKRISAALMAAEQVLLLDNVNSTALKSDTLASVITERPSSARPLGTSRTVKLNSSALVAVTGNGLTISEDLARRFVLVELDAGMEDPEARDFRDDFIADTMAARDVLLTDALTIWRWGRQMGDALKQGRPAGSFPQWGQWCRDPLIALGCADPVERVQRIKAEDPRRQNMVAIFTAWWSAHGSMPVAASELAAPVRALVDPSDRGRQYLAARVRAWANTRVGGFVLKVSPAAGKWSGDRYFLMPDRSRRDE